MLSTRNSNLPILTHMIAMIVLSTPSWATDKTVPAGTYTESLNSTNDTVTLTGSITVDDDWGFSPAALELDNSTLTGAPDGLNINFLTSQGRGLSLKNYSSANISGSVGITTKAKSSDNLEGLYITNNSKVLIRGATSIDMMGEYSIPISIYSGELTFNDNLNVATSGLALIGIFTMSIDGPSNTHLNGATTITVSDQGEGIVNSGGVVMINAPLTIHAENTTAIYMAPRYFIWI